MKPATASQLITRLPFEDMRELWYWGTWKEPVGHGRGYNVAIVCTSMEACRRYNSGRTSDHGLFGEAGDAPLGTEPDSDLFNLTGRNRQNGVFTRLSLAELVAAVKEDAKPFDAAHPLTLLVNPRKVGDQIEVVTDAFFDVDTFVNEASAALGKSVKMPANDHGLRQCLRPPIPAIASAALALDRAVEAHLSGDRKLAAELIASCNTPEIREWVESLWGKNSPYVKVRAVAGAPRSLSKAQREKVRMPTSTDKVELHKRDGYHCRFCGVPVIRREVRVLMQKAYPKALPWGRRNAEQHAAFQAMWAQYDHVLPHTRGGTSELDNLVVTCAPCNFARMEHTLEEVGLLDPRTRQPDLSSKWDGLERFR